MKQAGGQSSYEYLMSPHLTRPQGEGAKKNNTDFVLASVKFNLLVWEDKS